MSEPKFTPGPWVAINASGNCGYYVETGLTNETVCDLYFLGSTTRIRHDFENSEANAHLIAAAPELYKALERIDAFIDDEFMDAAVFSEIIYNALKKARGESHD